MQRMITATSLKELRDELNQYLERGWTIVPGSVGISSYRVVSHPDSERPRTPGGESFRVGCWAVVKKKSDATISWPELNASQPTLPESVGTSVPSTPSSDPANPSEPAPLGQVQQESDGLPTGASHAPSGVTFTDRPSSPEHPQGTADRLPAADLASGEAPFSAKAEAPRSRATGETSANAGVSSGLGRELRQ